MGLLNWWVNSIKVRLTRFKGLVGTQILHVPLRKQVQTLGSPGTRDHTQWRINHRKQSEGGKMGRLDFEVETWAKRWKKLIECDHRNIKTSDIFLKFQFSRTGYQKQRNKLLLSPVSFRSESPGTLRGQSSLVTESYWAGCLLQTTRMGRIDIRITLFVQPRNHSISNHGSRGLSCVLLWAAQCTHCCFHPLPLSCGVLCAMNHRTEFSTSGWSGCYSCFPFSFQILPPFQPVSKGQRATSKAMKSLLPESS